ncbi:E3 ubiquitin-protein ligase TRIM71-like [Mercenaria mercenaria]|uniref:E3 ubiquitin-protein ligase TRIM71-like n=1 Tax=Mercenaria mercenaria TaxID=6596 RepID=UPI00234EBD8F|nr:E3 ubiquitin-protein ligase TRIM71-like [Mercenaria mercenaria]
MATSRNYNESVTAELDEVNYTLCEPCAGDEKQIEAEGFCFDCSEYLCEQCFNSHGRFKAFKHHILQDKDNVPVGAANIVLFDVCVEKCQKHTTKIIEYFCQSCDSLGCTACITTMHRQCQNVEHVPDIAKDLENNEELIEFEKDIHDKLKMVNDIKATIRSRKCDVNKMKRRAMKDLNKQRDEINRIFDHLEAKINQTIADIDETNMDNLNSASDRCNIIDDGLNKMKTTIETKRKNRQNCELFIAMKILKASMENLDQEYEMLYEESKIKRYKLAQSSQTKEVVTNINEMCRILTAQVVSEFNIGSCKDEVEPSVGGLAVVQKHYLAVSDNSNKTVKIVDTRNDRVTSEISLDCDYVWNVTSIKGDQIVVSMSSDESYFYSNLLILAVSKDGALSKNNLITTKAVAFDLVGIEQSLYILDLNNIIVIDIQGNVLKEIICGTTYRSIAVSTDKNTIYLINGNNNSVQSMTLNGQVTATYKDKRLKCPWGVTVDNEGFVYVRSSDSIHQLTKDCTKVQVIIEDVFGTSITYSGTNNRLYMGDGDKVKVYELK